MCRSRTVFAFYYFANIEVERLESCLHCLISEDRQVHYTDAGASVNVRARSRRQCALIFFSPRPVPSEEHFQLSTIAAAARLLCNPIGCQHEEAADSRVFRARQHDSNLFIALVGRRSLTALDWWYQSGSPLRTTQHDGGDKPTV